ncbi:MAG: hypothetical protein WCX90_07260 [Thiohalomonadaceae bacterium]
MSSTMVIADAGHTGAALVRRVRQRLYSAVLFETSSLMILTNTEVQGGHE